MSITQSQYGERWFEFDRAIGRQLEEENARRQYYQAVAAGEKQTFEEWMESGKYDRHDWENATADQ